MVLKIHVALGNVKLQIFVISSTLSMAASDCIFIGLE